MGLIGSAIGGAASVAGGLAAASVMKQNIKDAQARMAESKAHMTAKMYVGPNAADMAAVTNAQQINQQSVNQANAQAAVTGGTPEAVALAKQAGAQEVSSMLQNQAAQREQRADAAWTEGQKEINNWQNYINSARSAQAQAITQAAGGMAEAANSLPW